MNNLRPSPLPEEFLLREPEARATAPLGNQPHRRVHAWAPRVAKRAELDLSALATRVAL